MNNESIAVKLINTVYGKTEIPKPSHNHVKIKSQDESVKLSDDDMITLADAFMAEATSPSWIRDWVSNQIDLASEAGHDVESYISSSELISKLFYLSDVEINDLEKKVATFLQN